MSHTQELIKLLNQGVHLIPVHEEGKQALIKFKAEDGTPFARLDILALNDVLTAKGSLAVAALMGSASGRLICIDVDSKHYPGFDATFLRDTERLYPDIFPKLWIEKTPSGGYHFFYRIGGEKKCPRSEDIAKRWKTEEEIEADKDRGVKNPAKTKCFLEIKCEGILTQLYPSPGYTKQTTLDDFSVLTEEEHESLIALCRTYHEAIVEDKPLKLDKKNSEVYSENPFEHFNTSQKAKEILADEGWQFYKDNGKYRYYTRPDSKTKQAHAGFNSSTGKYTIWTTNADVDAKTYTPANLLAHLKYDGNKQLLFAYLVSEGYGKLKPAVEARIVKHAARHGGDLPANISDEARFDYDLEKARMENDYPFGVFWEQDENGVVRISREDLYKVSKEIGFRTYNERPCYINGMYVEYVEPNDYYNVMKEYIGEADTAVFNAYENFLQNSGKFTITRIEQLRKDQILTSSKKISYKFYKNCYISITKDEVTEHDYSHLDKLIWKQDVRDREYHNNNDYKKSLYWQFLQNAIGFIKPETQSYVMKCIGYYAHDYKDEQGYFMIATETCSNPKDGGGSGKNIFWNLFNQISTYKSSPASQTKRDNTLLQSWNGQRVFCLADMPKGFDLIFFKELITGSGVNRKLYKDEYDIPIEEMPKICGSSNYSYDDGDPGVNRRVRAIEFTQYYTLAGGVYKAHGKMFPNDWDANEFSAFDTIMVMAIQEYLKADCMIDKEELTEGGWIKQFDQKYVHLHDFIKLNIEEWRAKGKVKNDDFNAQYDFYCKQNNINVTKRYSSYYADFALENYCKHYGIEFHGKVQFKENNIKFGGRIFGKKEEEEDVPF